MGNSEFMPGVDLFPRLSRAAHFLHEVVRPVRELATHGDHSFSPQLPELHKFEPHELDHNVVWIGDGKGGGDWVSLGQ